MKPNHKTIYFYVFFTFLYIFPLLLVNNYYIDDIARSLYGYGWQHDGRSLSTKLMQLLSFGDFSVDLFPYTIMLAAVVLAFSGYYISKILNIEQHQQIKFSGLLILTSPFMLENLSYRWDSLTMSISIISIIIPFLYISSYKKFIPASILGILICLFTFQPSIVIYGLLIICLTISYCLTKTPKDIIYLLKVSFASFIMAFILYKIAIKLFGIYFSNRNLTVFSTDYPIELLTQHLCASFELIKKAFNYPLKLIFSITLILFLIALIKFSFSKKSIIYKIIAIISVIIIPLVIISTQVVPLITGVTPRVLVGFSFFFYTPLLFINFYSEKLCKYISIVILIISFPLMAAYSNSIKNQNNFEKFLANDILSRTEKLDKNIIFDGIEPWAPELKIPIKNFPILSVIVPRYMQNQWPWGRSFFNKNTYSNSSDIPDQEYLNYIKMKKFIPIIDETDHYYVKANDSIVIISFKKNDY